MKRNVKISVLFGVLVLCVIALIFLFKADTILPGKILKNKSIDTVFDFTGAYVQVRLNSSKQSIGTFVSESGDKYLFLPSQVKEFQFENLNDDLSLSINGETFKCTDYISAEGDFDVFLNKNGEIVDLLRVLKSKNISTVFIQSEFPQEKIDETNGEKYDAYCAVWDASGIITISDRLEYIKTRGNTTFIGVPKKAYELGFASNIDLIDGISTSEWILLANYFDDTLLRGHLVYRFSNKYLDIKAPTGKFVDLYINGDYRGNYYLCNKPHGNYDSIGITDLEELDTASNPPFNEVNLEYSFNEDETAFGVTNLDSYKDHTGGYIIELTPEEQIRPTDCWFKTFSGFIGKVRAPKHATLEEVEYIQNYFNELEEAAISEDGINHKTGKAIDDYLDIESYTTRYFIDLAFANADSRLASSFFYKDSDSIDSKIYCGPLWDYDQALYGGSYYEDININTIGANYLCDELLNHEEIASAFKDVYDKYIDTVRCEAPSILYNTNKLVEKSRTLNNIRWDKMQIDSHVLLERNIEYLETRLKTIDERVLHPDPYVTLSFYDAEDRILVTKEVKYGECLDDVPIVTSWTGIFAGWYNKETGKQLTPRTKVYEDGEYASSWLSIDLLVQNGINASNENVENVDIHELEAVVAELKRKKEASHE